MEWADLVKKQLATPKTKSWQDVEWKAGAAKRSFTTTVGETLIKMVMSYPGIYDFHLYKKPESGLAALLKRKEPLYSGSSFGIMPASFLAIIRADISYLNSVDFDEVFEVFLNLISYDSISRDEIEENGFEGFLAADWKGEGPLERIETVKGSVFLYDENTDKWKKVE